MKPFVIFTALLLTLTLAAGLLYVGYNYGLKNKTSVADSTLRPTTIPLSFKPPIPLNEKTITSAHMQYVLDAVIGDVSKKNNIPYVEIERPDHSVVGVYKLADGAIISDVKTPKKRDLGINSLIKGRQAQVNMSYNAYQAGREDVYISYIFMR